MNTFLRNFPQVLIIYGCYSKVLDIIQLVLMINIPRKLGIKNSLNFIKIIYQKSRINTILNGEYLGIFPLK